MSVEGLGLRRSTLAAGAPMPCLAAPPMAPPPSAQASTVFGKLRRAAFGAAGEAGRGAPEKKELKAGPPRLDEAALEAEALGHAPGDRPVRRTLTARVVLERDGKLVLELELDEALAWDPPDEVTLLLADGTGRIARVVKEQSTGAASLPAGTTLRLVLSCGEPALAAPVVRVEVDPPAGPVRTALSLLVAPPSRRR
jgi:hypothetical protein